METENDGSRIGIDGILARLDIFEILEVAHKSEEAGRLSMTVSPHFGEYAFVARIGKGKVSLTPLSCMGEGLLDHFNKICRTSDSRDSDDNPMLTRSVEGTVEEVLTEKGRGSLYRCEFEGAAGRSGMVFLAHMQRDSEETLEVAFLNEEDMCLFKDVIVDQQLAAAGKPDALQASR